MVSDIILNRKLDLLLSEMGIDSDAAYEVSLQDIQPGICTEENCNNIVTDIPSDTDGGICPKCGHNSIMSLQYLLSKFV